MTERTRVQRAEEMQRLYYQKCDFAYSHILKVFSLYTLLVEGYALGASVCHTSVNPGRCKEEAEFRDTLPLEV